jgi:hypothetical protein
VSRLVVRTGVFLRRIAGCCSRGSGGEQKPTCLDIGHNVEQFAMLGFLCTEYCLNPVVCLKTLSVRDDNLVADIGSQ